MWIIIIMMCTNMYGCHWAPDPSGRGYQYREQCEARVAQIETYFGAQAYCDRRY